MLLSHLNLVEKNLVKCCKSLWKGLVNRSMRFGEKNENKNCVTGLELLLYMVKKDFGGLLILESGSSGVLCCPVYLLSMVGRAYMPYIGHIIYGLAIWDVSH